jgi:hypothetical protein
MERSNTSLEHRITSIKLLQAKLHFALDFRSVTTEGVSRICWSSPSDHLTNSFHGSIPSVPICYDYIPGESIHEIWSTVLEVPFRRDQDEADTEASENARHNTSR